MAQAFCLRYYTNVSRNNNGVYEKSMSYFAEQLKKHRMRLNMSMQTLGDKASVSKSMICKMERGEVQPTIDVAHRVASALSLSLSEMLAPTREATALVTRKADQVVWEDANHVKRRTLSPVFENLAIDWLQIERTST